MKVPVQNLKLGMYVARLDRPWSETPIALQGFQIQSIGTLNLLQEHCSYVYDVEDGGPLLIAQALEPGAFGIRPDDYYLPKSPMPDDATQSLGSQLAGGRR